MNGPQSFAEVRNRAEAGATIIPVTLEFSADLLTPVSAFLRLARTGDPGFLLESVEGGERLARYSFLGIQPYETWSVRDGVLTIRDHDRNSEESIQGNPFREIGKRLGVHRRPPDPSLPPFTGGAVGYVGYESSRYLERIPSASGEARSFDIHLKLYRSVIAFDHVKRRVILISNILRDRESLRSGYQRACRELEELRRRLSVQAPSEKPLTFDLAAASGRNLPKLSAALGPAEFAKRVHAVKNHIRRGDIFQCVLSDEFTFPFRGDAFGVYRALRTISPAPYLFHLAMGDEVLTGASPELLTRVSDGLVETCPIAGTRPRGRNAREDLKLEQQLLASVKERAEHLMLVDLGRNDVGRVSKPGSVRVRDFMQIERYSHVMHLVSRVEGKVRSARTSWDALASCFPAGTLSGAPKVRAMEIIARLEPVQRGPYGGAVVYCDYSGRLDSCITIRSLFVRNGTGHIRAGAGIVADSQAQREYQEILNKTLSIRTAVALAGGSRR